MTVSFLGQAGPRHHGGPEDATFANPADSVDEWSTRDSNFNEGRRIKRVAAAPDVGILE